ncbi:GD17063 [Drosophila simulans]|uniref:GD17063 n=1 Tax=Drosophila simulans TaxID=7240 RepID=B4R3L7_DROSI|nr:GD17063 [Drosophila simulans]
MAQVGKGQGQGARQRSGWSNRDAAPGHRTGRRTMDKGRWATGDRDTGTPRRKAKKHSIRNVYVRLPKVKRSSTRIWRGSGKQDGRMERSFQ